MNSVYYYSPQSPTFSQLLHKHMYHFTLQTCATVLGKVSYVCVKEMMMMMLLFGSYSSDPPFFGIVVSQQLYRHNFPLPPTPLQVSQAFFFFVTCVCFCNSVCARCPIENI